MDTEGFWGILKNEKQFPRISRDLKGSQEISTYLKISHQVS